ncbi:hypothetical protein [Bordetella sp. BOR01]|uniref:hypothetical protein n=1 Tax=Bordetella sp. BOR01 TaxID=2854779 RepID=UPI001C44F6C9|nr:hypothetical protein [Bordetella sp. BOR01]MBV7484825.1 hypothetical protein [Bordetella sp. BOR01]
MAFTPYLMEMLRLDSAGAPFREQDFFDETGFFGDEITGHRQFRRQAKDNNNSHLNSNRIFSKASTTGLGSHRSRHHEIRRPAVTCYVSMQLPLQFDRRFPSATLHYEFP